MPTRRFRSIVWVVAAVLIPASAIGEESAASDAAALDLFSQRIMPIFRSPNPSSCVQCHLAAVDLKNYILPSHEQTFASLRVQGLVDVEHPRESKILTLIQMGDRDADKGAKLIHKKTRQAEHEAFAAWIEACCHDAALLERTKELSGEPARPAQPDPVIRHARKSRVVDSFVRNVWSQRMRCFPCHTPYEIDPDNPQHEKPAERHRELVKQYGTRVNIFRETPEATLQQLINSSRKTTKTRLPMLNLAEPRKSLLILKPTAKLPPKQDDGSLARASSVEPVSHGGGLKMHVDDQSYKSFVAWIQDYARVVGNQYQSVEDLPADNWIPTQLVVRLTDCSDDWPVGTPVQLFVHAWDEDKSSWNPDAMAFTQGTVTPRKIVNGMLFMMSPASAPASESDRSLAPGKYRISVHVDREGRIAKDPTMLLGDDTLTGHVETEATWGEGFRNAEVVSFEQATTN
jgi:hypothetical protein